MTKRIGIIHGLESSFPEAFIAEINGRHGPCTAEAVRIEAGRYNMARQYDVIVDRISHEVPFYQTYLKQAALLGARVINNPFWRSADDKYFGTCLAAKLGIAVPKTAVLPQKEYLWEISSESLSNLVPLDCEAVTSWTGFPCFLKPVNGHRWKEVWKCHDLNEFLYRYNQSGRLVMMLQEEIAWEAYARLVCIGQEHIHITPWDPRCPPEERYTHARFDYGEALEAKMIAQARLLNRALGYDMNSVEFAIKDGIPYAIDFMNTSPDFDRTTMTSEAFDWVVKAMADLAILHATQEQPSDQHPARWRDLL